MGPVLVFYIAFASISLFACILQLFISFRKSGDFMFLVCSVFSLIIFISFSIVILCASTLGISCDPFTLLRYQLILNQAVAISMIGVVFYLLKDQRKLYILINVSVFGFLLLGSLVVPDDVLFGINAETRRLILPFGDNILMIQTGFTLWRALIDLNILLVSISIFLLLIKRLEIVSFRTIVMLFSGLGLVLLAAIYDQFVDLGHIYSIYMLPFAFFVFYIILIFIPFVFFIKEIINQENIIQQQKKWQSFINETDIIVVGLNRMGQVESINPYFFELTGFVEEDVLGKDWFEFFVPPKDFYQVQSAFIEILEFEFHPNYLSPILTKNKEEKMIRWFNARTRDPHGEIAGSLSIGVDISSDVHEKEVLKNKLKDAEQLIARFRDKDEES